MLIKDYPQPERINYVPSPLEPDEDGVQDIGYATGRLSDGRGYRVECWRMDDMKMVTLMFSSLCLTGYTRRDMALLLELEQLVQFNGRSGKPRLQAALTQDDAGHDVWAINLMLSDKKGSYADLLISLRRYF